MEKKKLYIAPATSTYIVATQQHFLKDSPDSNYISNPTVGGTDENDEIATDSRRSNLDLWDECDNDF